MFFYRHLFASGASEPVVAVIDNDEALQKSRWAPDY